MADKKEKFAELKNLANATSLTAEDTQKLQDIINQIAQDFANEHKLSIEDFNNLRRFATAHADDFKNAVGGLESALRASFLASLQQAHTYAQKQETKGVSAKNNLDTIIHNLHIMTTRKQVKDDKKGNKANNKKNNNTEDNTEDKTAQKEIIKNIIALNKEMIDRKLSASQLTSQQKETLKKAQEKFPAQFETAYERIETPYDEFTILYNEVTGSDKPTSGEKEAYKKMSADFSAILQSTTEQFATTIQETTVEEENVSTPDAPENNTADALKQYISGYFPFLTEEEVSMVSDVFKQTAESLEIENLGYAISNDDFITDFAIAISELENLATPKINKIVKQALQWEENLVSRNTDNLLNKETLTDDENLELAELLRTPAGKKAAVSSDENIAGLNKVYGNVLDKAKAGTLTENEGKLSDVIDTTQKLKEAVLPTAQKNLKQLIDQYIEPALETLKTPEDQRTDKQKEKLEALQTLANSIGLVGLAALLAEKNVKDLTDTEKAQLRELASDDRYKDILTPKLQELEALANQEELNSTPTTTGEVGADSEHDDAEETPGTGEGSADTGTEEAEDTAEHDEPSSDGADTGTDADTPTEADNVLPDVTKEEVDEIINQLNASDNENTYIKNINPKLKKKDIEASLSFDTAKAVAITLSNPDDMLQAYHYIREHAPERAEEIQEAIRELLKMVDANYITPDNAYALNLLAKKANFENDDEEYEIKEKIAKGLKKFDLELYGNISDEKLAENYDNVHNLLEGVFKDCGSKYLSDNFIIIDDDGKELKDKNRSIFNPIRLLEGGGKRNDLTKQREAILEMARELIAQDLAKTGAIAENPDGSTRILNSNDYEKLMRDKIDMLLGSSAESTSGGKIAVKCSELAKTMGGAMTKAEEFKSRAKQRFGTNGKLYKAATTWLERLDAKLNATFGKPYRIAKKAAKIVTKGAVNLGVGALRFAAIGYATGGLGIAAYLGYMGVKQWKSSIKEAKDKDWKEKAAIYFGATVSTGLTGLMAVAGLGDAAGAASGIVAQCATNFATHMGMWTRTIVTTAAYSMKNLVKSISIRRKIKKADKAMQNETDPDKLRDLLNLKKSLYVEQRGNIAELAEKAGSAAIGTFFYTTAHELMNGNNASLNGAKPDDASSTQEIEQIKSMIDDTRGADISPQDATDLATKLEAQFGSKGSEIYEAISKHPDQFLDQFSDKQLADMGLTENSTPLEIANAVADPSNNATISQIHEINSALNQAAVEHTGNTEVPATEAEIKAQNLQHAAETKMHPSGNSVADMTTADLNKIGLGELSTQMQEAYGEKAYMAIHSAVAEPTNVVDAIKATMPAEEFAKLGFDNSPSSPEVARILANNPQLASNEGLNNFMSNHFNAAQEYSWTPGVEPTTENLANAGAQTPTREPLNLPKVETPTELQQAKAVEENPSTIGHPNEDTPSRGKVVSEVLKAREDAQLKADAERAATETMAEKSLAEQEANQDAKVVINAGDKSKVSVSITINNEQTAAQVDEPATPVDETPGRVDAATLLDQAQYQVYEPVYGSQEYLAANKLVEVPELSRCLNHTGHDTYHHDHTASVRGFWCVAMDPETGVVHVLPNDPVLDQEITYPNLKAAMLDAERGAHGFNGGIPFKMMQHHLHGTGYTYPYNGGSYGDAIHTTHRVLGAIDHTVETVSRTVHAINRLLDGDRGPGHHGNDYGPRGNNHPPAGRHR